MAISQTYNRPVAAQTASESGSYALVVTEDATNKVFIIDLTCVVGANTKLVKRFKLPLNFGTGSTLTQTLTEIVFPGDAANRSSSTVPADTVGITNTVSLTSVDMDAFYTAAGDARS